MKSKTKLDIGGLYNVKDGFATLNSGKYLSLSFGNYYSVSIKDIASGLSKRPRWSGQTEYSYSVGQHSIDCYNHSVGQGLTLDQQLQALMHDASEAFMGDMAKPWKNGMTEFQDTENVVMTGLGSEFGFEWPLDPEIKEIDTDVMEWEYNALFVRTLDLREDEKIVEAKFIEIYNNLTEKIRDED